MKSQSMTVKREQIKVYITIYAHLSSECHQTDRNKCPSEDEARCSIPNSFHRYIYQPRCLDDRHPGTSSKNTTHPPSLSSAIPVHFLDTLYSTRCYFPQSPQHTTPDAHCHLSTLHTNAHHLSTVTPAHRLRLPTHFLPSTTAS